MNGQHLDKRKHSHMHGKSVCKEMNVRETDYRAKNLRGIDRKELNVEIPEKEEEEQNKAYNKHNDDNNSNTEIWNQTQSKGQESLRPSAEGCIFVANLPAYLSNDQLTEELWKNFYKFGEILSIKASRDPKGRPFAFIQFQEAKSALFAARSEIFIAKRKSRIEKARCLRKVKIATDKQIEKEDFFFLISGWLDSPDDLTALDPIAYIIKLKDSLNAEEELLELKTKFPAWEIDWYSSQDRQINTPQGSKSPHSICYHHQLYSQFNSENHSQNCITCESQARSSLEEPNPKFPMFHSCWFSIPVHHHHHHRNFLPQFPAECSNCVPQNFKHGCDQFRCAHQHPCMDALSRLEHLSISPPSTPMMMQNTKPPGLDPEIFIGRLNAALIDQEKLAERFSKYGSIENIQIVNRKNPSMVPQDAFAFIRFSNRNSAQLAIDQEHGQVWMGQAIRVTWAISRPSTMHTVPDQTSDSSSSPSTLQFFRPQRIEHLSYEYPKANSPAAVPAKDQWNKELISMMLLLPHEKANKIAPR